MSDYETAKKAAAKIMEKMREIEGMAIPGTHDHWQFVSAGLMQEWARIRFVLETIEKNYEASVTTRVTISEGEMKVECDLYNDELDALWRYHHEAELTYAGRGSYDDAKYHKERADLFWRDPLTRKPAS